MNGDIKIGKLLCDEDIITKRQLNKALQRQVKGDKRTLGEILVDLGFVNLMISPTHYLTTIQILISMRRNKKRLHQNLYHLLL